MPDSPGPGVMNWVRAAFGFAPDGPGEPRTPAKQRRDRVYRVRGLAMFGTMALAGLASIRACLGAARHPVPVYLPGTDGYRVRHAHGWSEARRWWCQPH
jgi:hypothetical protein